MGTYRQPETAVDTTSAQAWTDASDKMAKVVETDVANVAARRLARKEAAEAREKANKETAKKQNDYYNETAGAVNNKIANKGQLFDDKARKSINDNITVASKFVGDGNILTQQQQQFVVNTTGLADNIATNLGNMDTHAETYTNRMAARGEMGGYSLNNDPAQFEFSATMFGGGTDGEISFRTELDRAGTAENYYTVTTEKNGEFTYTGSMINQMAENPTTDMLISIPDEKPNMDALMETHIFQKDNTTGKTSVKDIHFTGASYRYKEQPDGRTKVFQNANSTLLKKVVRTDAAANVISLQKNEQLALYDFLEKKMKGDGANSYPLDHVFENEEDQKEFEDELISDYIDYALTHSDFEGSSTKVIGFIPAPDKNTGSDGENEPNYLKLTSFIDDMIIERTRKEEDDDEGNGIHGGFTAENYVTDINSLEEKFLALAYDVGDYVDVKDDEGKTIKRQYTVTKTVDGSKNRSVTITTDQNPKTIKLLLKYLQTGVDVALLKADGKVVENNPWTSNQNTPNPNIVPNTNAQDQQRPQLPSS